MEFKNSFLSRIFGTKPEEAEVEEEQPTIELPEEEPDKRHRLELPADHALRRLWSIYKKETGSWQPDPDLALEGPEDPMLPDEVARRELMRLQIALSSSAKKRFELLDKGKKEAGDGQVFLPDTDAEVMVFLSKDCMNAWLMVYPPVGKGKELTRKALDLALSDKQVFYGIDTELLDELPNSKDKYFRIVWVARGAEPEAGLDGRVVDLFPRVQERKLTVDEHNRVDYTSLSFINNVEKDGVICRIIPPTEGRAGRTVQNKEVAAKNGKPASAPKGRNTVLSEDGQVLTAAISGHVEFSGRSFMVKPVLDIPGNVDFSVGSINFLGDVCIKGDICSGFTVRATGNITVGGVVEACSVEAGRDLIVAGGIQGDKESVIRAQRSIFAKFLENSCVYARETLEAECIINCDIYCDGSVTVRSGYRSIIGGKIHAAHEVNAGIIGSRAGARTDIVLGGRPCEEFDYELLTNEVPELEKAIERTMSQPESPSKDSALSKLRMQLVLSKAKIKTIDNERDQRTEEPEEPGIQRMECDTVFPGTILTIGNIIHKFENKTSPCFASVVNDELQLI